MRSVRIGANDLERGAAGQSGNVDPRIRRPCVRWIDTTIPIDPTSTCAVVTTVPEATEVDVSDTRISEQSCAIVPAVIERLARIPDQRTTSRRFPSDRKSVVEKAIAEVPCVIGSYLDLQLGRRGLYQSKIDLVHVTGYLGPSRYDRQRKQGASN